MYCDTKYSWSFEGGVEMSVEQVWERVNKLRVGHVVITGAFVLAK